MPRGVLQSTQSVPILFRSSQTMCPAIHDPRSRGVVAVIVRDGRFLVMRRSDMVIAPGMICFPGGGIELGESQIEALVREIHEELGVTIQPLRRIWESVTPWGVRLCWWLCRLDEQVTPIPNPAEVAECFWLTNAEMAKLPDLLESNHHFLAALQSGEIDIS